MQRAGVIHRVQIDPPTRGSRRAPGRQERRHASLASPGLDRVLGVAARQLVAISIVVVPEELRSHHTSRCWSTALPCGTASIVTMQRSRCPGYSTRPVMGRSRPSPRRQAGHRKRSSIGGSRSFSVHSRGPKRSHPGLRRHAHVSGTRVELLRGRGVGSAKRSLDHFIGPREQRRRHRQANGLLSRSASG